MVTEDTTRALSSFDDQFEDRSNQRSTAPLIDPETGMVLDDVEAEQEDKENQEEAHNGDDDKKEKEEEEEDAAAEENLDDIPLTQIQQVLMSSEETFLEPLPQDTPEVQEFLSRFDIEKKTDEISSLLLEHPDTLQVSFAKLTSDCLVDYQEFWKRYFFRFESEDRMRTFYAHLQKQQRLASAAEKAARIRKARMNPLGGLAGVTNFLGTAVMALVEENESDDGDGTKKKDSGSPNQLAGISLNFFGAGGRPPFVLNTAVSEDEDDDGVRQSDEEELGWDDDEDDDDEEEEGGKDDENEDDPNVNDSTCQIEFKDVEKEKLQEQLQRATEERDQLQKTVETQTKEIKALKEATLDVTGDKKLEALQMKIFEKDAELAALKARLDDNDEADDDDEDHQHQSSKASMTQELERLRRELANRDSQVSMLEKKLEHLTVELQSGSSSHPQASELDSNLKAALDAMTEESQRNKALLEQAISEKSDVEAEKEALRATMVSLQAENTSLSQNLQSSGNERAPQLVAAQLEQEASQAQSHVQSLQSQLNDALRELEGSNQRIAHLEVDLQGAQNDSKEKEVKLKNARKKASELEAELQVVKKALEERESELAKVVATATSLGVSKASPSGRSSPGSESTGVKVESSGDDVGSMEEPMVSASAARGLAKVASTGGDDDEEGWGDDW